MKHRLWIAGGLVALLVQPGTMVAGQGSGVAPSPEPAAPRELRAFYMGHSLSSDIPDMVAGLVRDGGGQLSFRHQDIPGAPLRWQWGERDRPVEKRIKFEPQFQGHWFEHFPKGGWTALVMVDSVPRGPELMAETRDYAARLIGEARKSSPELVSYIYEPWHCIKTGTPEGCDYDNQSPTRRLPWRKRLAADGPMWDQLVADLRKDMPGARIELIPAGRALGRLTDGIEAGQVPGLKSHRDLFDDDIHLNPVGKYFVACVHYAKLTGKSPEGRTVAVKDRWGRSYWNTPNWQKKQWPQPTQQTAQALQRIAWEAVEAERK